MGYSYSSSDSPRMCFNAAKMHQLGWYDANKLEHNPITTPVLNVDLRGAVDYNPLDTSRVVLIKLQQTGSEVDYYLTYNAQTGFNSGTQEAGNQVIVNTQGSEGDSYAASELVAKLSQGGSYTIPSFNGVAGKDVVITVNSINTSTRVASISIVSGATDPPTSPPTSPPLICSGSEFKVSLEMTTDQYASLDNSLSLTSTVGDVIWSQTSFPDNTEFTFQACLDSDKCYNLDFDDSYGDGFVNGIPLVWTVDGNVKYSGTDFEYGYSDEVGNCEPPLSCLSWCPGHSQPWSTKCGWASCMGCSACDSITDPPTQAPKEDCLSWCPGNTATWETKCGWASCLGCTQCDSIVKEHCLSWCAGHSEPWSTKCGWNSCNECDECGPPDENCLPWCPGNTNPWSVKCGWASCQNCSQCS